MRFLKFKRLFPDAELPRASTAGSIGLDLFAYRLSESGRPGKYHLPPRTTVAIRTGILVEPPDGCFLLVCSRSGLAKDRSLFVSNGPGIIDPDYRGEILVLLYNGGLESYYVQHGDRVGQLVVLPVTQVNVTLLDDTAKLSSSERGAKGFGSSGR